MTNTNVAAETISNTIYETKPYGTPEEFNLQTIPEKIIDVEYTEVDDDLERKSANDNDINNNPTPPVTTNALIPVGNSCLSVALPVTPENLITCIEFNQSIAEATMKMVKKYGFTKSDMEQLYQKAWKHAAIVFEAQSRLGKFFKNIGTAQGSRTDLLKTIANKQLPGKSEKKLTKEEFIKQNWGYDTKKAWELEQLANDNLKKKTYEYAKIHEEYPSLKMALKIRKEENEKLSATNLLQIKNQAKHENEQKKLQAAAIKDAVKFSKLTRKTANILPDNSFDVIYADCVNTAIPFKELMNIPVPANDNSILLLWTDNKNLSNAFNLVKNWGFEYQESVIWNYMSASAGKFVKNQHRQLLICAKGEGLKAEYQDPSVLNLHKNEEEYARKYYYSMIEQMFPDGAYLDMFANTAHNEKWSLWSEIVKNAMIEEK